MPALAAAEAEAEPPVAKRPLESDRPEADEAAAEALLVVVVLLLPPLLLPEEATLVLALLPAVDVLEEREGGFELVDDIVGVVEVKTLEKFARPFIMLGLLRKGELMPNWPSGLYSAIGLKLEFG